MAWFEEIISGNLLAASGLVVGAYVLKRFAPELAPGLESVAVAGLKLFAEAEFEQDDGIIGKLAEHTVKALLQAMPSGKPDAARDIVGKFERTARRRSARHAWNERDRRARYRHHVHRLKSTVARTSRELPADQQAYLRSAFNTIAEDC
jgi:hypothetical protein